MRPTRDSCLAHVQQCSMAAPPLDARHGSVRKTGLRSVPPAAAVATPSGVDALAVASSMRLRLRAILGSILCAII